MNMDTLQHDKETRLKKLRSKVYALIGFYRSRGFLNRGQMYALEQAANGVINYDYNAYTTAKNIISKINYETQ